MRKFHNRSRFDDDDYRIPNLDIPRYQNVRQSPQDNRSEHEVRIFKGASDARFLNIELHARQHNGRVVLIAGQTTMNHWRTIFLRYPKSNVQCIPPNTFHSMNFKNLPGSLFLIDEIYPNQLKNAFELIMRSQLKYFLLEV